MCQWWRQIELDDVGCIVSDEALGVLGAQGSEPGIQHAAYFGHSLRLGDRQWHGHSSLKRSMPGHTTRGVIRSAWEGHRKRIGDAEEKTGQGIRIHRSGPDSFDVAHLADVRDQEE